MKNENNKETMNVAKKAVFSALVVGGLLAGQTAQASVTTTQQAIPERVAAVRDAMAKKVSSTDQLGLEAAKLPYAQMEIASWLNWVNWPNWNNWGNWRNWSNWSNWINF